MKDIVSGKYNDPSLIGTNSQILHQISSGISYLHLLDIVHRDLRPCNVMVSSPFNAAIPPRMKITNFAFSRIPKDPLRPLPLWKLVGGNKGWMAPEVYLVKEFTSAMDVYALGLIFAYLLNGGLHAFGEEKENRILRMKTNAPMTLTIQDLLNKDVTGANQVFQLICLMLDFNAEERPSISQVLADGFWNNNQRINRTESPSSFNPTNEAGTQTNIDSIVDVIPSADDRPMSPEVSTENSFIDILQHENNLANPESLNFTITEMPSLIPIENHSNDAASQTESEDLSFTLSFTPSPEASDVDQNVVASTSSSSSTFEPLNSMDASVSQENPPGYSGRYEIKL